MIRLVNIDDLSPTSPAWEDVLKLEIWEPKDVAFWYLTQNNFTRIEDNRKGHEKIYELVRYGRWEKTSPLTDTIVCSNCGYNWPSEEMKSKYCPGCGAEMREEQ